MTGRRLGLALLLCLTFAPQTNAQAANDPQRAAAVRDHQACIMLIAYVDEGIDNSRQMAIWRRECDRSTLRDLACARLKRGNVSTEGMRCEG